MICGKPISFNPVKVPSLRDKNGTRQPVCRECIEKANIERKKMGIPLLKILPGAYEACEEGELA